VEIGLNNAVLSYWKPEYAVTFRTKDPLIYFIRRTQFDNDLLNLAKEVGVEVREGARVKKIESFADRMSVKLENGERIEGKIVLGADGVNSVVRKFSGLQQYWNEKTLALVYSNEIEIGKEEIDEFYTGMRKSSVHMAVGGIVGYGWIFPKLNHINLGYGEQIYGKKSTEILENYFKFVKFCQENNEMPKLNTDVPRPLAWRLQFGGPMKKFATKRILLLGDAAGFVHPASGEGIYYALNSAQIVSECISNTILKNKSMDLISKEYEERCLLEKMPAEIIEGRLSFNQIRNKMLKRILIGIFKGNLWKK
jgi:flavin-dependent dehydrogenase